MHTKTFLKKFLCIIVPSIIFLQLCFIMILYIIYLYNKVCINFLIKCLGGGK